MNISVYFLELSNPSCSFECSYDDEHSACLAFDAKVTYPNDETTSSGEPIASAQWRVAIYDQTSKPELDKPPRSLGMLTWRPPKSSGKPATCLAQVEVRATIFSRILTLLQTGNKLETIELTVQFSPFPWDIESGNTAIVVSVSVESAFQAATSDGAS